MNSFQPAPFPFITLLTLLPFTGAIAVLVLSRGSRTVARATAAAFAITALAGVGLLCTHFAPVQAGLQLQEWHTWAPSFGLAYHVGVDGLSLLMLAVSSIVVAMSVAASWSNEKQGPAYFAFLLFLETALFGAYTAQNFLHWFLYWELSLIPAFFLIRLWGTAGRAPAATQFFVYTMVGSIPLLLVFLALFLASGSFDFSELARLAHNGQLSAAIANNFHWNGWHSGRITMLLFWGAFLAFAIKTPIVPFHSWQPLAYSEAAPETTMVLTGALSKMGVYGFLRILLPIFPGQMLQARTVLLWLAIASIVLPALAAWAQTDLRKMMAYSSINHLGYCVLGIVAVVGVGGASPQVAVNQAASLTGVMLQLFSHGISAAALFWFLALLARRSGGQLGLDSFGGLRRAMPVFSGLMGITLFASLGLPGLIGFPGEFLIFKGVFPLAGWAASLAVVGLLLTAVFLLTLIQRVFSGPLREQWAHLQDLSAAERWMTAPVICLMFVVGLYPQLISRFLPGTVLHLLAQVRH